MHFRFFDYKYLMGSAPEACPEFRFEQRREHSEKIIIKLFKKCLENLPKICTKLKNFQKN